MVKAEDEKVMDSKALRLLAHKAIGDAHVAMADDPLNSDVNLHIPTGWSLLDANMGGGLPCGRVVEIYGREASGKSTLLYQCIAQCQKMGGIAVLLDSECVFPKDLAQDYGIKLDKLMMLSPDIPLEDVFQMFLSLTRAVKEKYPDLPILFGWDTLVATPTKGEVEDAEQARAAQYRAQVLRQGLRSITYEISKSNVAFVILNQGYEKAGMNGIVSLETPGGLSVKYYSTVRIQLRNFGLLKASEEGAPPLGMKVSARFEKNKLAAPRREVEARLFYGKGFSDPFSILDYAVENGIIKKAGPWNTVTVDGKDIKFYDSKYLELLEKNEGLLDQLRTQVMDHYRLNFQ